MSHEKTGGAPEVSVVIPAFNAADVIGEQLDALRRQVGAPRFEVLLCDNNSTDATGERAVALAAGLDLKIVDSRGRGSASFARNRGAEAARGDILLFCDSDDLVGETWVASHSTQLFARENAITVGVQRHEGVNSADVLAAYDIGPDRSEDWGREVQAPPFAGYLPTIAGGNFGIHRAHYLALRGMDASYPGGSEETDFSWRAQEAGAEVIVVPTAVVDYRLRSDAASIRRQQWIQQYARVLLWTRFRDAGMNGPSAAYSVREVLRTLAPALLARQDRAKLRAHRILGGNLGALHGMLVFRVLKQRPQSPEDWWTHPDEENP